MLILRWTKGKKEYSKILIYVNTLVLFLGFIPVYYSQKIFHIMDL